MKGEVITAIRSRSVEAIVLPMARSDEPARGPLFVSSLTALCILHAHYQES